MNHYYVQGCCPVHGPFKVQFSTVYVPNGDGTFTRVSGYVDGQPMCPRCKTLGVTVPSRLPVVG